MTAAFRIHRINGDSGDDNDLFRRAVFAARRSGFRVPSVNKTDYEYIQVTPMSSYLKYHFGNDGMQGWRHVSSGLVFPDICRLRGGCPEMWHKTNAKQIPIANLEQIRPYIVHH
jgi:hypothetical protein